MKEHLSNMGDGFRITNIGIEAQILRSPLIQAINRKNVLERKHIDDIRTFLFVRPKRDGELALRQILAEVSGPKFRERFDEGVAILFDETIDSGEKDCVMDGFYRLFRDISDQCTELMRLEHVGGVATS